MLGRSAGRQLRSLARVELQFPEGIASRMQRLRKCLGVDIGSSAIKLVELAVEKKALRVVRCLSAEIPSQADGDRSVLVLKTLKELLSKAKGLGTKAAVFSIPGQNVFIRRIMVPRTSEERLQKIIAYEARQQIPFSLDTAIVEYQILDDEKRAEVEVVLAAVKRDVIKEFMKVISKAGLKPVAVAVSSLALFNFHAVEFYDPDLLEERLSGPKKLQGGGSAGGGFDLAALFGKKKPLSATKSLAASLEADEEEAPPEEYEEVRAFINVGAQTFDLAIAKMSKVPQLGFVRSVANAGQDITRILQDKMRLEDASQAEDLKRNQVVIVIPGRENESMAPGISKEASDFVTSWADRLISDIRRSFDYYISQPEGMAVDSIYLSGGTSQIPNLATYIEEKLGIPVEYKQRLNNPAFVMENPPEEGLQSYIIGLGLAVSGLGIQPATIDFLPVDLKNLREFKRKNIEAAIMVSLIGGMVFLSTMVGSDQMDSMERWLSQNSLQIQQVNQVRTQAEAATAERAALNDQVNRLGDAVGDRLFWLEFLGAIETAKPPDVLITRINMNPDGKVTLVGETETFGSINNFLARLQGPELREWVSSVNTITNPREILSLLMQRRVTEFQFEIAVKNRESRLNFVRQTFGPGMITPSPTPAGTPAPAGMGAGRFSEEFI